MQVRCKKGDLAATFCIDMLRTPYFFKNRHKTVTINGHTKPIFHIVRTHKRTLKDGTEKSIKTHFRGVRHFDWNDYRVNVTMPGWHHGSITDMDVHATAFSETEKLPVDMITDKEAGRIMAERMDVA